MEKLIEKVGFLDRDEWLFLSQVAVASIVGWKIGGKVYKIIKRAKQRNEKEMDLKLITDCNYETKE